MRTLPTPDDVVVHGAVVAPTSSAPTSSALESKVSPASSGLHQDELDPELEYELTYGAPEYDPGYEPEPDEGELSDDDSPRMSHDRDLSIGSAR